MDRLRLLLMALALVGSAFIPTLAAARADEEAGYGANPICFAGSHNEPTGQPPDAVRFGQNVKLYQDDCLNDIVLPNNVVLPPSKGRGR